MKAFVAPLAARAVAALLGAPAAVAQGSEDLVESQQDWSVFARGDGNDKVCWIASSPTNSRALRDGKAVDVRRGDIYLMVSFRPSENVAKEVSFISGYPFKQGSTVEADVGDDGWEMFTVGENAWLSSSDKDEKIVEAFKGGADAKFTGLSSRGTTTIDTFSLMGFTAAVEKAEALCG